MHAWTLPLPPPRPAAHLPQLPSSRRCLASSSCASFFAFTCCYSKISCLNRHLGSTLPPRYPPSPPPVPSACYILRFFLSFFCRFFGPFFSPLFAAARASFSIASASLFVDRLVLRPCFCFPVVAVFLFATASPSRPHGRPRAHTRSGFFRKKHSCASLLWGSLRLYSGAECVWLAACAPVTRVFHLPRCAGSGVFFDSLDLACN